MSGHSKWANIKNRKGAQDKKRSEAFTKMAKDILTAIRIGGGNTDPNANTHLKTAIEKARGVNMPKENIERLISRFEARKDNLTRCQFEGFGPFGVPMVIEAETDNKNRILGEIRLIFRNYGGNLGEEGSLGFLFDRVGEIELKQLNEEAELKLIDAGVLDFDDNTVIVVAADLKPMADRIGDEMGMEIIESRIVMRAKTPVLLQHEDELTKVLDMVEELEDNDDVINVFAGFDYHV
jgi:YebC/PmpR family DNA-binding regulatory protein